VRQWDKNTWTGVVGLYIAAFLSEAVRLLPVGAMQMDGVTETERRKREGESESDAGRASGIKCASRTVRMLVVA